MKVSTQGLYWYGCYDRLLCLCPLLAVCLLIGRSWHSSRKRKRSMRPKDEVAVWCSTFVCVGTRAHATNVMNMSQRLFCRLFLHIEEFPAVSQPSLIFWQESGVGTMRQWGWDLLNLMDGGWTGFFWYCNCCILLSRDIHRMASSTPRRLRTWGFGPRISVEISFYFSRAGRCERAPFQQTLFTIENTKKQNPEFLAQASNNQNIPNITKLYSIKMY